MKQNKKILYHEEIVLLEKEDKGKFSYEAIGAIKFTTRTKKVGVGSGILISNNLVLTTAHNLYDRQEAYEYDQFRFYLEKDGEGRKYYQAEAWRYLNEFKTCQSSARLEYDYALVKLNTDVVDRKDFLQLSYPCQICLMSNNKQAELCIFGYPYHQQNFKPLDKYAQKIKLSQYGLARNNRIVFIEPTQFKIAYSISTYGGQSGCPVVEGNTVIALHNGSGLQNQQFNVGRFMSYDLLSNLQKWSDQLKGTPFEIINKQKCNHRQQANFFS